jgi:hypothetical protein
MERSAFSDPLRMLAPSFRRFSSLRFGVAFNRAAIARRFIQGSGIEIGALHNPLRMPRGAQVRYVDRMPVAELRRQYPELEGEELVEVESSTTESGSARSPTTARTSSSPTTFSSTPRIPSVRC